MPRIEQQKNHVPKPATRTAHRSNGLLAKAVPVEELEISPLKVLMYGANRTGKTTLACQFPKPLLLVSFEPGASSGLESVRKVPGVRWVHVVPDESPLWKTKSPGLIRMDECLEMLTQLWDDPQDLATVVGDGATSCQDVILANMMGMGALPEQLNFKVVTGDQYRDRAEFTKQALRRFLDLSIDTVILAKEKDHNPPKEEKVNERTGKVQPDMRAKFLRGLQTESFVAAELGGATVGWLQDCCDCICRLYVEPEVTVRQLMIKDAKGNPKVNEIRTATGKYIRVLRTGYHPNFAAGIRSCDPSLVPDVIEQPTYDKLVKVIRGT